MVIICIKRIKDYKKQLNFNKWIFWLILLINFCLLYRYFVMIKSLKWIFLWIMILAIPTIMTRSGGISFWCFQFNSYQASGSTNESKTKSITSNTIINLITTKSNQTQYKQWILYQQPPTLLPSGKFYFVSLSTKSFPTGSNAIISSVISHQCKVSTLNCNLQLFSMFSCLTGVRRLTCHLMEQDSRICK